MAKFRYWGMSVLLSLGQADLAVASEKPPYEDALAAYFGSAGTDAAQAPLYLYRPDSFPRVTFIGHVAPDAAPRWRGVAIDGVWQAAATPDELAPLLLPEAGWDAADAATREAIAVRWVEEIVMGGEVLRSGADLVPPAPDGAVHPAVARTLPDGTIEVSGWVSHLSVAGEVADPFTVRLAPDGTVQAA
ncbi:hypothetical protein KXS07_04345 [Inquilinus limosus]|uniref:hypothetical protein n=1 Tax=Inquilinus limosus TaxID=171674 RepID=UPI0003F86BC6|nr:hypothetical protein [Inquilinus limosus]